MLKKQLPVEIAAEGGKSYVLSAVPLNLFTKPVGGGEWVQHQMAWSSKF